MSLDPRRAKDSAELAVLRVVSPPTATVVIPTPRAATKVRPVSPVLPGLVAQTAVTAACAAYWLVRYVGAAAASDRAVRIVALVVAGLALLLVGFARRERRKFHAAAPLPDGVRVRSTRTTVLLDGGLALYAIGFPVALSVAMSTTDLQSPTPGFWLAWAAVLSMLTIALLFRIRRVRAAERAGGRLIAARHPSGRWGFIYFRGPTT